MPDFQNTQKKQSCRDVSQRLGKDFKKATDSTLLVSKSLFGIYIITLMGLSLIVCG